MSKSHMDPHEFSSVSYLDVLEGIKFDGRSYALQGRIFIEIKYLFCFSRISLSSRSKFQDQ